MALDLLFEFQIYSSTSQKFISFFLLNGLPTKFPSKTMRRNLRKNSGGSVNVMVRGYICRTHGWCYVTKRNVESSACLTQGAIGITLKRARKLPLFIVQPDQLHILGTFTGQSNLNSTFRFRHNECYVPFIHRISTLLVFASTLRFPPFGRIISRVPNFTGQFPTDLLGYTSCYSRFANDTSNEKIFANIWIHV